MKDPNDKLTADLFGHMSPYELEEEWEGKYGHSMSDQVLEAYQEYQRMMNLDNE